MNISEGLTSRGVRATVLLAMAACALQLAGCAAVVPARSSTAPQPSLSDEQRLLAAVARNPGDADAHDALGKFYAASGREALALREFQLAAGRAPDYSRVLNNLGYQLLRSGQLTEAVEVLRRALALDPLNAVARANLSLASRAAEPTAGTAPESAVPAAAKGSPAQSAALVQVSEGVWQLRAPTGVALDTLARVRPQMEPTPQPLALRMTVSLARAAGSPMQARTVAASRTPLRLALTARLGQPTL